MAQLDEFHRRRLKVRLQNLRFWVPKLDQETSLLDVLKPCPACQDEPFVDVWQSSVQGGAYLQCLLCGHWSAPGKSLHEAVENWNTESLRGARQGPHKDKAEGGAPVLSNGLAITPLE